MRVRKYRTFVCDFETTVYKGQKNTEVWAAACVELFTEDVNIFHSISETFDYLNSLNENLIVYFHNLKFDGSFWLSYFLLDLKLKQAYIEIPSPDKTTIEWLSEKEMEKNTFKYSISNRGQWYTIIYKNNKGKIIELRDSLKLLPFSVRKIGKSFGTKHKKLEMEYTGFRYAGCKITEEEKKYIANDVLVVKEALEIMFNEGHNKLTIGSCCLEEFKRTKLDEEYSFLFPNVYEINLPEGYGKLNAGEYIRKAYKGGWCYLVKGKENKLKYNGTTADVNSLYPSMMHSESGNRYPVGMPTFWKGNYIPDIAKDDKHYYFVRIRTRFSIKKNYLPFIQIKGNLLYKGTECLTTSDIYNRKTGKYERYSIDLDGNKVENFVELTLTMTDWILLNEHYNLYDCEILDGCYFEAEIGLFDTYIDKYKKIKMESKGAIRELAKLFLNNLYGKMASSKESSFKVAYLKEDGSVGFFEVEEYKKEPGYIPIGAAITSYARNFTIRAAQMNYYGPDKPGFIYADTDSIHCDLPPEKIKGIKVDSVNFCCWKLESNWDKAIFVRQKTYVEHITHENLTAVESAYYNVKCAGMPDKCKQLFIKNIEGYKLPNKKEYELLNEKEKKFYDSLNDSDKEFLSKERNLTDFKIGLLVPGKLLPKRIPGGVLLCDTTYEMR